MGIHRFFLPRIAAKAMAATPKAVTGASGDRGVLEAGSTVIVSVPVVVLLPAGW